jgi:hypothetical protein
MLGEVESIEYMDPTLCGLGEVNSILYAIHMLLPKKHPYIFCILKPDVLKPVVLKPDVLKPDVLWVYRLGIYSNSIKLN